MEDGISRHEFNAVRGLIRLADAGYAEQLLEEQWVVEGKNLPALESLWVLNGSNREALSQVMSHPTISDGISEQEAKIVAALHPFLKPDQLEKLLDPEQVILEERTITLPLGGDTHLSIVRTRPGGGHTMDLLERAVRNIEEFMGLPFPRRQAVYLFEEGGSGGSVARNLGIRVVLTVNEQALTEEQILGLLTHETSHYYWSGGTYWIHEGAATFLESVVGNTLKGPLDKPPCSLARSIAELEDLYPNTRTNFDAFQCNYALGERLFRDLHRNMDETSFRQAFRRLYLHTEFNIPNDECDDDKNTICHVREAFSSYASDGTVGVVDKVIARWHDGTEPYDLTWIDDSPVQAQIAPIDGAIENAYLSFSPDGLAVSTVTLEPNRTSSLYVNLEYSYQPSSGLNNLPIEIALSYEDGFEIQRRQTLMPLPAGASHGTHSMWIRGADGLGRYRVNAYWGEQKIAEVNFETVPATGFYSIRGVVTNADSRQPELVEVVARRGEEEFGFMTGLDSIFNIRVSPGTFVLQVYASFGNGFLPVGWYDGEGGITIDRDKAFELIVNDAGVGGIEINLAAVSDVNIRGVITGPGGRPLEPSESIELAYVERSQREQIYTQQDGSFYANLPKGTFNIEVLVLVGSEFHFIGWYDGDGSITTDPNQAYNVEIDNETVHEMEIMLPSNPEDLLCPSGSWRSTRTGQCTS